MGSWVPNGLPRYPVGHLARLDAMERLVAHSPGLILAGASYRGSGVTDCVRDGERAAEAHVGGCAQAAARSKKAFWQRQLTHPHCV